MTKAKANRIVLSECYYKKVTSNIEELNIRQEQTCMGKVSGRFYGKFKGIPRTVPYRYIDV